MSNAALTPIEQLIAFCDFERQRTPNKTHIAEWALHEIYRQAKDAERYRFLRAALSLVDSELVATGIYPPEQTAPRAAAAFDRLVDEAQAKIMRAHYAPEPREEEEPPRNTSPG